MKKSILRKISLRLIGEVGEFENLWEPDSTAVNLKQRISRLTLSWLVSCHGIIARWRATFRKELKRRHHQQENHSVEQIDLFAYLEELVNEEASTTQQPKPAPSIPSPVSPVKSLTRLLKRLLLCPYQLWILAHNLFGIACWVNVYTVTRSFGGREAGGWYYLKYHCERSRQVGFWEAQALRLQWLQQYTLNYKWGDLRSKTGGQDVIVCIESRKAARKTKQVPRYSEYASLAIPLVSLQ